MSSVALARTAAAGESKTASAWAAGKPGMRLIKKESDSGHEI
jgi:hypothetical protein